ncbi:cilia- and flagella-associated protein 276 [Tautogolabrus adspersus]
MTSRDPFPSPKCENDFTLSGFRPQQRKIDDKPAHIAQTEEPWSRLHYTATSASTRRGTLHYEFQGPNDRLDFQLKSIYDHHKDLFWRKNQTSYQKETFSEDQKEKENLKQDHLKNDQENEIKVWVDPKRLTVYSIK